MTLGTGSLGLINFMGLVVPGARSKIQELVERTIEK